MTRQSCHFHSDEDLVGTPAGEGTLEFRCTRNGHPDPGPYSWLGAPAPSHVTEPGGLAVEMGIPTELIAIIGGHRGKWIEYGVIEAEYAKRNPTDFATLVERYGHTAIAAKNYTVSSFLGGTLGQLGRNNEVIYHSGPATGRWSYNPEISWWTVAPEPDWTERTSWAELGKSMDYIPGNTE